MRALVLDGYTDEPACLGVPPFISPNARLAYGALAAAGAEPDYATVDQWRAGTVDLAKYGLVAVIRNLAVPGKYLRGMPASDNELIKMVASRRGHVVASLGVKEPNVPASLRNSLDRICFQDLDALLFDIVSTGSGEDRRRTSKEWNDWLIRGAIACTKHPDHGGPLIAEVQMYRGCVRYITGGCKFCVEPLLGDVFSRRPQEVLSEVEALARAGVSNFRLGAQSCVYCYMSAEIGKSETPRPNPEAVNKLLRGIRQRVKPDVFHLDNANPAVIADHPVESKEITKAIAENCTSGNVLAFGLESADPAVAKANNLNATPEQTIDAIRLVNDIGAARGPTGLPLVLPGINFVCGLDGESKDTYNINLEFLRRVLEEKLLLRRINIRQVIPSRRDFPGVRSKGDFVRFRNAVRNEIDSKMLERLLPDRTVLTGVHAELREGTRTFGRQVGSYPLLVSIPYPVDLGSKIDVAVVERGYRSVSGVVHPTDANTATLSMLRAIPGIGKKRASAIVRSRPFKEPGELWHLIDEPEALESAQFHLALGKVHKPQ